MRYRYRSSYRYTMLVRSHDPGPFSDLWPSERLRMLAQGRWVPDTDVYETAGSVEVLADLAGVDEDDFEIHLFEDALVVEGRRQLSAAEGAVYHAAGIRQGLFQVEIALPAPIDAERVEARYDRGLLRITLPKRA
jgi:HSP20 family molecular chaperone IbpA